MPAIPDTVRQAWNNRQGPVILATTSPDGIPNAIYATCVSTWDNDCFVVADNYFDKTRRNIQGGSSGSILFITEDGKAYQAKGWIEYHTEGPVFDAMKSWNPSQHPGHAAAALHVQTVFSGAEKVC